MIMWPDDHAAATAVDGVLYYIEYVGYGQKVIRV